MAIVEEDLERLRASLVLSDVVQQHLALRRVGRNWVGLCPFHAERSGSFNVRDETGRYRCFGCGAAGDVFKFVQEIEHVDFVTAVESLASKAGIQLTYTTGESGDRTRQKRRQLVDAMAKAVEWYHDRLLNGPDARAARDYLRKRGLAGDTARTFKIGWAPDEWDALCRDLGVPADVLRETGLATNKAGRIIAFPGG
jgi:DNA primase